MSSKNKQSGQAALEYLITYGWALVMIATIIGVLLFATGGINTNTCTTFLRLLCKGINADGDRLILILQNATGQKITINPFTDIGFDGHYGYAKIIQNGEEYRFEDVTIGPGEEIRIEAYGMALAKTTSITYYENNTGITRTITSSLSTDAPNNIEISNNGIDDDGDGTIDCADTDLIAAGTQCEYVIDTPISNITNIAPNTVQITFGQGSTMPVTGNWWITQSVIVFDLKSYTSGTDITGTSTIDGISGTLNSSNIKTGINNVTINNQMRLFQQQAIGNYTLSSTIGNLTVSSAKVVLTVIP